MDAEDRRIPFIDEFVRGIGECALGSGVRAVPISTSHVPVGKPHLLSLQILHLYVENTVVSNKRLEAMVVMPREPINREAAETCSDAAEPVFIYKRLFGHLVDCRKIVFHTLATVVATHRLVPFHTEARETAPVRSDDDIIVCSHDLEIPAVGPELADGTLRSAFAVKQGGVFLRRIEMRRIDDPD